MSKTTLKDMNDFAPSKRSGLLFRLALGFSLACAASTSFAVPINVIGNSFFRDTRSPNNVGFTPGDRLKIIADVTPNPISDPVNGILTQATASQGSTTLNMFFVGDVVFPNEFSRTIPYDANLTGSWDIEITNPTSANSPVMVSTHAIGR